MSLTCIEIDNSFGPYAGHCRGGFDLTLLFEEAILTIPVIGILLLITPFRINFLLRRQIKVERSTHIVWKLSTLCLLAGLQLASLIIWVRPSTIKTRASIATAALSLISTFPLLLLSYTEHVFTVRPSTILDLFLLFSSLFDAVRARTLWLQTYNRTVAIMLIATISLKLVSLLLEGSEKRRILRADFRNLPPEAISGIFSRWAFSWQLPLFISGYSKSLGIDDLYVLDKKLDTEYLHAIIRTAWQKASKESGYALLLVVVRILKWPLLSIIFPRACYIFFTFCQPFLISTTIEWSEEPRDGPDSRGYGLIGAFFLVYTGIAVSMGQHQHLTFRAITMMRGQLISLLYERSTDLSLCAIDPAASLTLMSADIERIDNGWRTMHEVWANLVEIAVAIYLLERQLGIACLVPVATALASIICSVIAISFVMARQALWLEAIERRVAVTSTMLGSMKGVKMYGLTSHLSKQIHDMRLEELHISKKFRKLLIWNMGLAFLAPIMAPVLTFMTYSLLARNSDSGATLDTSRVFTSLSLFALLQEPLSSFIMSLNTFVGSVGCFVRIQSFLLSDLRYDKRVKTIESDESLLRSSPDFGRDDSSKETKKNQIQVVQRPLGNLLLNGKAVVAKNCAFAWDSEKAPILSQIDLEIPAGKITAIVGPVGCGKSTLLKAFLGELNIVEGSLEVSTSKIAFCDQNPWHMNGSIKESIIGFSAEDDRWYQLVVRACALEKDLQHIPKGDNAIIGSKGVALSGGQSQRIALARAVYAQKDVIILDDVLSGLDASTENSVFHNLFGSDGVLRRLNTTVIIASSTAKRLPYVDHIISINNEGRISEQGTFEKLDSKGGYVSQLHATAANWRYYREPSILGSDSSSTMKSSDTSSAVSKQDLPNDIEEETNRRTGDVTVYLYYARAIGWLPVSVFVSAICAYIFCQSFPTIWVSWWAAANTRDPNGNLGYYLGIYAMLGVLALIFLIISCWQMIVTMVPLSGKNFHWSLLQAVLNSPMSFFAQTDSGVTINRFSQDLQLVDMDLPISALNTFATFVLCIAQMVLIGVGSPFAAISFPFIICSLYLVQRLYLRTSRQLRFLDLEAKSPLYSQFTETMNGLATLRAFGWRDALIKMHYKLLDRSQRPYYLLYAVQRWLTFVLDMFVALLALLLIVIIVELRGTMSPGLIGVALTNVILFSQNLKLLLQFWTNLETHIGAISRIKSFTTNAISEHMPTENNLPPSDWPSKGVISFDNVSAGYKTSEPVVKNISLSIDAGQKIGICGRTGSGKSSLVATLFRMADLFGGRVTIDGIDTSTVPREEIRSRVIGVPQDTFLFSGTARANADPTGNLSDDAIIRALQSVQLWTIIESKGGLDTQVDKLYLSHGQKQLFCLARAMLRPSPIVVLDEATSSIDTHTEKILQKTIREKFASHTVIAVVHRLESVLDFDKIAVLDGGELAEFDSPHALLSRPDSSFSGLYRSLASEDTGLSTSSIDNLSGASASGSSKASSAPRTRPQSARY